ncbi:MAG: PAS domain-containing protein [Candidatus Humimicrobiaceae bacterium]
MIVAKAFCDEQNIIKTNVPLLKIEEKETYEGRKDRWVSTIKMPLYDKKGKIIGTFGISRDITEHKQAEEEIKSLSKFPEENPNIVGRIDYHGKILYCNHACKRIFKDNDFIPNKLQDAVKKIATEKISIIEEVEIEIGDRVF